MWMRVQTAKTVQLSACFGIKPAVKVNSMPKYRVVKKQHIVWRACILFTDEV
jgi:hypothetical protein